MTTREICERLKDILNDIYYEEDIHAIYVVRVIESLISDIEKETDK